MRILIVEDEPKMAGLIHRGLEREGMAADVADNGEDALWRAQATEYDAIVLDVMLPGMDGFEVCGRLREAGVWSPILMLTARDAVRDRVAGLDRGADDYLTKPFSYAELLARLRALFRRGPRRAPRRAARPATLRLDPATQARVARRRPDRPVGEGVRGPRDVHAAARATSCRASSSSSTPGTTSTRTAPTSSTPTCGFLRKKIDKPFGVESIETVRGAGYRLREDGGR